MAFSGGDQLQARLNAMAQRLDSAVSVRAGILEGAVYEDGTSVAMVAAINEFGAPSRGQPPRSFMRPAIAQHSSKWGDIIAEQLRTNDYDAANALRTVGVEMAGDIQDSIQAVTSPPLAPSTVARKGSPKPLIDTSHMIKSVSSEVQS